MEEQLRYLDEQLRYLKQDVWKAAVNLILTLEREDAYEIIKNLPEEPLKYSKPFLEHAYENYKTTEYYKCKGREELFNNLMTQIKNFCQHRIQMRESKGWKEVNKQIRQLPKCLYEDKIIMSGYCPICKKVEPHKNRGYVYISSEDEENDLRTYIYDPKSCYYLKRVCKACKIRKIQTETSAAA